MSANGRVASGNLIVVQRFPTIRLERHTGIAFKALQVDAKRLLGRKIRVAPPGGGYRSWAVQAEMQQGSKGNLRLARKWKLNPYSKVPLAGPGSSSHGYGTRVDIIGTVIDFRFINLAGRHGFNREFGPRDPNHFAFEEH